jgi:hypothetical protein
MTHEELLAKLAYTPHTDPNGDKMHKALRAIVKLHKPERSVLQSWFKSLNGIETNGCRLCNDFYPCPTIEAIQLNLQ